MEKEGNDTINTPSAIRCTVYIADLGSGDDTVSTINQLERRNFFDGGEGTNDFLLYRYTHDDHFAFNSSDFADSYKPTNASILTLEVQLLIIITSVYFKNFERIAQMMEMIVFILEVIQAILEL